MLCNISAMIMNGGVYLLFVMLPQVAIVATHWALYWDIWAGLLFYDPNVMKLYTAFMVLE